MKWVVDYTGHICPIYFVSQPFTETKNTRKNGREISFVTKSRVARRDNYICQICGKPLKETEIEFDHIIPISKGGSSEESNIRVTCIKCNREKGNKIYDVVADLNEFFNITLKDDPQKRKEIFNMIITNKEIDTENKKWK